MWYGLLLQVAYPIWDTSLLTELDMDTMEKLFVDANLLDVWEARRQRHVMTSRALARDELDTPGISWDDVLSLGEQQRLQFCRRARALTIGEAGSESLTPGCFGTRSGNADTMKIPAASSPDAYRCLFARKA